MLAKEVTLEEIKNIFPPENILEQWHQGQDAEWPPPPTLRFSLGTRVECRVGPSEWSKGTVIQLWYREENWAPNMVAPYKIQLIDGRNIFAPADADQIIRLDNEAPTNE